jgi:predicted ATP-dependent protease
MLDKKSEGKIEVISVKNLSQVLEHALALEGDRETLLEKIKDLIPLPKGIEKPSPEGHRHAV